MHQGLLWRTCQATENTRHSAELGVAIKLGRRLHPQRDLLDRNDGVGIRSRGGTRVTTTTRSAAKADMLREAGAEHVPVDDGAIAAAARDLEPGGFSRVLELVGTTTLFDSLATARRGGIVCMTGILGG